MKVKHNKKRNTAFLFEALVREMTKAAVRGDKKKKAKILKVIKEHFSKGSPLYKELQVYKSIYETNGADALTATKIIVECRNEHRSLDKKELFKKQSFLISEVNKTISPRVYNNFVPNYRMLATIAQLFNDDTPARSRVLLENNLVKGMTSQVKEAKQKKGMDDFTFGQYVKVFNDEYSSLLKEQKQVLGFYINDKTSLMVYLNEEIGRLRTVLSEGLKLDEIKNDELMTENTKMIISILDEMKENKPTDQTIIEIMKIQKLVTKKISVKKTIDGNLMFLTHPHINVSVNVNKGTVLTFAKDGNYTDDAYAAMKRLLNYLAESGLVAFDSIQGGNIYASLQATFLKPKDEERSLVQLITYHVGEFLDKEDLEVYDEYYADEFEEYLLDPDEEDSTELGEVPQEEKKGVLNNDPQVTPLVYRI